jgi:hypothetical protein
MLASLLFAALFAPAANIPSAALGPPTLCHPLDIGDARSLPWDGGAFGAQADYDLTQLPQDTYDILLRSDDALVHVETLRRAAIYLTGMGDRRAAPPAEAREELLAALLQELEFDADVHGAEAKAAREKCKAASDGAGKADKDCGDKAPVKGIRYLWQPVEPAWGGRVCQAQARDAGLCFLDVGFLRAALREAGLPQKDDGVAALRDAQLLRPKDPALFLGATLGLLDHPDAATRCEAWKNLDSVLELAEDAPARESVRRNLLATIGPLLNAKDHDDLVRKIHERQARG